jgi:hypothetical protein
MLGALHEPGRWLRLTMEADMENFGELDCGACWLAGLAQCKLAMLSGCCGGMDLDSSGPLRAYGSVH